VAADSAQSAAGNGDNNSNKGGNKAKEKSADGPPANIDGGPRWGNVAGVKARDRRFLCGIFCRNGSCWFGNDCRYAHVPFTNLKENGRITNSPGSEGGVNGPPPGTVPGVAGKGQAGTGSGISPQKSSSRTRSASVPPTRTSAYDSDEIGLSENSPLPEAEEPPRDETLELSTRWLNFSGLPRSHARAREVHKVEEESHARYYSQNRAGEQTLEGARQYRDCVCDPQLCSHFMMLGRKVHSQSPVGPTGEELGARAKLLMEEFLKACDRRKIIGLPEMTSEAQEAEEALDKAMGKPGPSKDEESKSQLEQIQLLLSEAKR